MTEEMITLDNAEEIIISRDIEDPDIYIDKMIKQSGDDSNKRATLELIKELDHEEKVAWLLGLPTHDESTRSREPISGGCVLVVVGVVVLVVVGWKWVSGSGGKKKKVPIKERQEKLKKMLKCTK